jgi:hypothetical protein
MKKKEVLRLFTFSDAVLITKTREKIAFIRRDIVEFEKFGVSPANVLDLENKVNVFADNATDVESLSNQTEVTTAKDVKAEVLRVAIRDIMTRAELKFGVSSAKYRKFGADALSRQTDAELAMTGKRVVRVGNILLAELADKGLTPALLAALQTITHDFEVLVIDTRIKVGERDIQQEARVEIANAIYSILVSYTNTGQSIWATSNVAKYNDYIIYNTPTGLPPVVSI